jgi:formyltetrahydrofolate deformylase
MTGATATILFSCPDQQGLVAKLANFIYANGGNIIHADQHTDLAAGLFLTRLEWQLTGFNLPREVIGPACGAIAQPLNATWQLHFSDTVPRIALWVTKQEHCLLDLLWRHQSGEFAAEIPLILSNHEELGAIARQFGIDYHHLPMNPKTKTEQEAKQV